MKKEKIVLLVLFSLFLIFAVYRHFTKASDIENNKLTGIAKIYDISYSHYRYNGDYTFKYEGEWYKGYKHLKEGEDKSLIGRYFAVEFSSENPAENKLLLNKEIKDTLKIREAGFKIQAHDKLE
ncbi:hypothetical protein [Sinomicrobium weinanense]|uniref:Uncharacterized protein n=1 Tax=Sinomicrobium weinanense TaxID=2842200 RepID=A0A926JQ13_9FLAO|nr:hypothetical protein [Sinomicrobium weinanense]MBC9795224.1 hypothetical protein [Sinomicrobium weinanense]MBU3122001.1 hypothetical protein [Sinomicrobium weinanense]